MLKPMYIATEPFGPESGERWDSYVKWSGLTQLVELVSLDSILCPPLVQEIQDEDWNHNVREDFLISFFWDLDYLLERVRGFPNAQILAAVREPDSDCIGQMNDPRFVFKGFDVGDKMGAISALSDCGGFPLAFDNAELSNVGLIASLDRAVEIQASLRRHYPEEYHADCCVWALWRMTGRA